MSEEVKEIEMYSYIANGKTHSITRYPDSSWFIKKN